MTRYPQGNLKGVNTPWTEHYELDEPRFVAQVERLLDHGYEHLYVFGTAGEGHAVTDDQFRRVVDVFCDLTVRDGVHPQVGVITLSAGHAKERIAHGFDRGARMFQIVLPSWGVMSTDEKIGYLDDICGEFPDAGFLHYNYPRGMNSMSPDDYAVAVDAIPNLVATKISSVDINIIRGLMLKAPELQHFFLQNGFAYASQFGECSLICSLGPVFPRISHELFEAGRDGNLERAFEIQRRLAEAADGLYGGVSGPHIDGAFDKLTSWLVDPTFPRRLLPPYQPLDEGTAAVARAYYDKHCTELS